MHIHGAHNVQFAALVPTQSAQQAIAARKAAAEVRRKLASFSFAASADSVSEVDAYTPDERRRQDQPQDEEAFRNIFVSICD
jgi:hypothetical protein